MNQDLRWLAEKITEWNGSHGYIGKRDQGAYWMHVPMQRECFTQSEWQAARDELLAPEIGVVESFLGSPFSTPEEDEVFAAIEKKQERYQDAQGEDWIDEAARTFTAEEFRGAMKFTLGKYVRRAGKKDALESEIEKIRSYASRWLEYERAR